MNASQESPSLAIQAIVERVTARIGEDVFGQQETSKLLAGALILGGHVLLEGPPGVAKTLLAKSFARSLGLGFNRIQFTPDLMPSDITGVYIFDQAHASFRLSPGPLFADVVLADEINRTPPKTQSALLEAMQEHFVTIDGKRHPLGDLFFVIATQNPIEHEGTYPLPEAQLDRFLFKLNVGYPGVEHEVAMIHSLSALDPILEHSRTQAPDSKETGHGTVSGDEIRTARALLREIRLEHSIAQYVQRIAAATREHGDLLLGISPRAALALALAAKLHAALDGRNYALPDDVKAMCEVTLSHRLVFRPEVLETPDQARMVLTELLARIPVPNVAAAAPAEID
ncbi:MAG: AAA family ATPase [Bdellovibrionales bacterium]|nr:AAA family ATPase [Bdellovibrionales bacterium]